MPPPGTILNETLMVQLNISVGVLYLALMLPVFASAYDCANATDDLRRLQNEKLSTAERVAKGVSAILPIGIVIHSLKGNELESLREMGTDEHNRALDRRIAAIKEHCGLN